MITQLTINNFATVEHLTIEFSKGMTVITGETGSGKSLALDALSVCLGARSEASMIRHGAVRADISAHFLLNETKTAYLWLQEHQLEEETECIIRRVINQDGRSKAYINGRVVPLSQLREIGETLIQLHGQHEHQLLLKNDHQKVLLNHYLMEPQLLAEMKGAYQKWKVACKELSQWEKEKQKNEANLQLLQYQLKELDEFSPIEGEYEKNDQEYKRLANSEQLVTYTQQAVTLLAEREQWNVVSGLNQAKNIVQDLVNIDCQLNTILNLLDDALIQIGEASYELQRYAATIDRDALRTRQLEERLAKQIALSRKHQVAPESLPQCYQAKLAEIRTYTKMNENGEQLMQQIVQCCQDAKLLARKLHDKRCKSAKILAKEITKSMQELAMIEGKFDIMIDYNEDTLLEDGADTVKFLVSTNAGQPLQPIGKVASGGELSRLALAIQVLTVRKSEMAALIFDEIDVGVSGPTAAKVGNLLRELGLSTQVIAVTHLPQVAGCANEHFLVMKQNGKGQTKTLINKLDTDGRITELARLLAGKKITGNAMANAKELLVDDVFILASK